MTAYTTPTSVSTNDLITAAKMNEQWSDNIKHLHEAINSIVILEDQKTAGTDGGTFTSGSWQTRVLNTEVVDVNSICALSSNQFTLSAGTYEAMGWAVANGVNSHQVRIQNVTDGTTVLTGSTSNSENELASTETLTQVTMSIVCGRFTVAASKALELQHRGGTTQNTTGFGIAASFTTEVYAQVWLRKVA